MKYSRLLCLVLLACAASWDPRLHAEAASGPRPLSTAFPPEWRDTIERINASYYSLSALGGVALQFTLLTSETTWAVQQLRELGQGALADGLAQVQLTAIYPLAATRVTLKASTRPSLPEATAVLDALLADAQHLLQGFWTAYRPYVTQLLDPDWLRVQEIVNGGTLVIVRAQDRQTRAPKKDISSTRNFGSR